MGWMGECTGNRVEWAMAAVGVEHGALAARTGLPESLLAARLAAPASFRLDELALVALAVDRRVVELLPCVRGPVGDACESCG